MAGRAVHLAAHGQLALVAEHRLQLGGLADDAQQRLVRTPLQRREQRTDAQAADFLVVGERQVHRQAQRRGEERRDGRQHAGQVALHVRRATSVEAAIALAEPERRHAPGLAVRRHHVGMPGKADAATVAGADGGIEIGLAAVGVEEQFAVDAETRQVVADVVDQRQVGLAADGVEGHQVGEDVAAAGHVGLQGAGLALRRRGRERPAHSSPGTP